MTQRQTVLFTNQSADGNSVQITSDGAKKSIAVYGNFGGGAATLTSSPDNGVTFITLKFTDGSDAVFSANSIQSIDHLGSGLIFRLELSGSTGANLNAQIF